MPLYNDTLQKFIAPVFIETGTYSGEGVELALRLGFEEVHTVELDTDKYRSNSRKFLGDERVTVYHGSSDALLRKMIGNVQRAGRITFWLDAHPGGDLSLQNCPVAQELQDIADTVPAERLKAILIDDMRLFSTADQTWMENRLRELYPTAAVCRVAGVEDNDILAAVLP